MNLQKTKRLLQHAGWGVIGTFSTWAVAQPTTSPQHAQNATPASAVVSYQSPISHYQPYRDMAVQPWAQSNQTVQEVGGWRTYAKEAKERP
jgi:hypothetical protein